MSRFPGAAREADVSLAARDDALPLLAAVLDDGYLSELLGEEVRTTRVRYKPGTSALVAYRRGPGGKDYGWALTRAAGSNDKLYGRAEAWEGPDRGIRILRPDPRHGDALIAVGGVEDDWALRKNLRWLRDRGLARLGTGRGHGHGLLGGTARVLRYNPERRLVLLEQARGAPIVIKTAAHPVPEDLERLLWEALERHGVPVLPRLGDAACSRRGTSASPAWGDGDLAAGGDQQHVRRAGEALARLHGVPAGTESGLPAQPVDFRCSLAATRSMAAALLPGIEGPAAKVADRIRRRLEEAIDGGTPVLVHGDFSADQVLAGGAEVRLIDFDRAHYGDPETDLGSFAAAEEAARWRGNFTGMPRTGDLLDGYIGAGGRFRPAVVDAWAAFRLFSSSVDPFRDRSPDWAEDLSRHIARASELVP